MAKQEKDEKKMNFATMEAEVRSYWQNNKIFQESLNVAPITSKTKYVFYDGPPFANGLPHYGHLLTGFAKDLFARYHTMKGEKSERRFGWDCHGLPAEMEAEKQLGIGGNVAVKEYGIDKFNDVCRTAILKYTAEWEDYVTKQGRWVDFKNDYKTMDLDYMESTIWAFKQLFDKGLLYEELRVMPYSWKCQTPLSNFETHLDNSYRRKESKSIYVKFELETVPKFVLDVNPNIQRAFCLVWTTTPWTLPSNLALAVNKDLDYAIIQDGDDALIVARDLVESLKDILPKTLN